MCSIGILAGPITISVSKRIYTHGAGRNMIFAWTEFIFAGHIGLAVELFRSTPSTCHGTVLFSAAKAPAV